MGLDEQLKEKIVSFVKKEPRSIQEVAHHINKSWVTAETYVKKIKEGSGLLAVKNFRQGTKAAMKIAHYVSSDQTSDDEIRNELSQQITSTKSKKDFDFFEVLQFVDEKKKNVFVEEYNPAKDNPKHGANSLLLQARESVFIFSGNLSFINRIENGKTTISVLEELLKRKVRVKILCRITYTTLNNLSKIDHLRKKYPGLIEIRNSRQPLRGFIIDGKVARFKNEENIEDYKKDELSKNTRIFYEVYDQDWITWLEQVFWRIWRRSIESDSRVEQLKKYF